MSVATGLILEVLVIIPSFKLLHFLCVFAIKIATEIGRFLKTFKQKSRLSTQSQNFFKWNRQNTDRLCL